MTGFAAFVAANAKGRRAVIESVFLTEGDCRNRQVLGNRGRWQAVKNLLSSQK